VSGQVEITQQERSRRAAGGRGQGESMKKGLTERVHWVLALLVVPVAIGLAACSSDDGNDAAQQGEQIGQQAQQQGEQIGQQAQKQGEQIGQQAQKQGEKEGEYWEKKGEEIGEKYEKEYGG
jgi:hypothetical protein